VAWLSVFVALITVLAVCPPGRAPGRAAGHVWAWADKLLNCPWCAGFWISAAATLAYQRMWLGYWPQAPAAWFLLAAGTFATSWASAILADWLDSPPPPRVITLTPVQVDLTTRPPLPGPPAP
jgi:hypothetical protein